MFSKGSVKVSRIYKTKKKNPLKLWQNHDKPYEIYDYMLKCKF